MRIMRRAWELGGLIAAGLMLTGGALWASGGAVVHVKTVVRRGDVRLEVHATGPFHYESHRSGRNLYTLDLTGVSTGDRAGARVVASNLVKGYRVLSEGSGPSPAVRIEVLLAKNATARIQHRDGKDLTLVVSRPEEAATSATHPAASPRTRTVAFRSESNRRDAGIAIRHVSLSDSHGDAQVTISGSGPLSYRTLRLQNPDRLVLDFKGVELKTAERHLASNLDPVREIRMAQFTPNVSRVVIDLRESAAYNIQKRGDAVSVTFASSQNTETEAAPSEQRLGSTDVETAQSNARRSASAAHVIPVALTRPSPNYESPSTAVQTGQEAADATKLASKAASSVSAASTGASNQQSAAPDAPSATQAPAATPAPIMAVAPSKKYTGQPISVNLKNVDLQDFFRLIHEVSGLNVVVGPDVKGTVTIVLDDVPWDQALNIVLQNNDLEKQLNGNVLRIATRATLEKEAEQRRDLAKAQAEAANVITTTRVLNYAKASTMAATLKKFLSPRGDIIADNRSNTLIIRDIPSTLPVIDNLIRQLDHRSKQVEIEARVVAANRSFAREIGTQFGFAGAFTQGGGVGALGGVPSVGSSPTSFTPAPPIVIGSGGSGSSSGGPLPLNTNLAVGSPTSGIQYLYASPNFALDFAISAAENRGVGKLLSRPKIITQNNEKATVKQGTKIPVQTIVNNTVSVQFVDAVLELDVTPQITADGTVYMDVKVENDQIDQGIPRIEGIPAIDTQSAETKVTVNDGATVVIGGIIISQQRTSIDQVPLVGSVPLLGNLFKHTTVSSSSQELLFFLTPRILPS